MGNWRSSLFVADFMRFLVGEVLWGEVSEEEENNIEIELNYSSDKGDYYIDYESESESYSVTNIEFNSI